MNPLKIKIIVTGGRNFSDYNRVKNILIKLNPTEIIQGGCSGADALALKFAIENKIPYITYSANWNSEGRAAGPIRNKKMCIENQDATLVIFPGGIGTSNCMKIAMALGMKIILG